MTGLVAETVRLEVGVPATMFDPARAPAAAEEAIRAEVVDLCAAFGLPRPVEVNLRVAPASVVQAHVPRITVNGTRLRYPMELLERAAMYVGSRYVAANAFAHDCNGDDLPEVLALLCRGAILREPRVLVDPVLTRLPGGQLQGAGWQDDPPDLSAPRSIIAAVLGQRISLAPIELVREIIEQADWSSQRRYAEDLIAALRPDSVELLAPRALLRSITEDPASSELFSTLGALSTEDLGVPMPPLRLVADPSVRTDTFTFRVNSIPSVPWVTLPAGSHAVAEETSLLVERGLRPTAVPNPHGGSPLNVVDQRDAALLQEWGYSSMSRAGHVALCARVILRSSAHLFLDRRVLAEQLALFSDEYPSLLDAANEELDLDFILATCRALVAERISIRNLPLILDLLLQAQRLPLDEDLLSGTVARVRAGMPRHILQRVGGAADRRLVTAYLVDPELERRAVVTYHALRAGGGTDVDAEFDAIVGAFSRELDLIPARITPPVVIVSPEARPALRTLLASELSRLHIVAAGELPADISVQPIARVADTV